MSIKSPLVHQKGMTWALTKKIADRLSSGSSEDCTASTAFYIRARTGMVHFSHLSGSHF